MDDSSRVSSGQRVGDLRRVLHSGADAQAFAADYVIQSFARDVFHRDVVDGPAVYLLSVNVIDGHDVRVIQRRGSLRFLNEALFAVCTEGGGAQNLDGSGSVETRVYGFIHDTHSARTKF